MDEFGRIRHWTGERQDARWQAERGVMLGIGDDAAVVELSAAADGIAGAKRLLLAVDTMVETVHFNGATMRDEDVGYKALAANVSDIAAMGGVPLHALAAVSVPPSYGPERMRRVYDGLYACAERYGVAVIGGDTTSAPERLVLTVTLTGTVEAGRELRRSGAKPGDAVFLTGPVGMSAAGLHLLLAGKGAGGREDAAGGPRRDGAAPGEHGGGRPRDGYAALIEAHRRPAPSVRAGRLLLGSGACTSLNDVSDGLASEAWELAEASGLKVVLQERLLPRSGSMSAYGAEAGVPPLEWMLYGGEDYALLGTVAGESVDEVSRLFREQGVPFYVIGETEAGVPAVELEAAVRPQGGPRFVAGGGVWKAQGNGRYRELLAKRGYNHFEK